MVAITEDFQLEDRMNFDEKINDIRFASMEKLMSERFDRLQEVMEKNLSKYEVIASDIKGEMKAMNERIDKNLAEYSLITSDIKAEVSEIRGDVKALNASVQSLQQRRSWDIAWISLAVAVGIALIQIFSG